MAEGLLFSGFGELLEAEHVFEVGVLHVGGGVSFGGWRGGWRRRLPGRRVYFFRRASGAGDVVRIRGIRDLGRPGLG
ncbi:MAG: hypothetical protein RI897_4106 [Verrucomicrobiota bacterium]